MDDSRLTRRAVLGGIATIGVGGGVVYGASTLDTGGANASEPISATMHAETGTGPFDIDLGNHPIMGALDAPVSMYYWSEYQCPFCARFDSETFPKLIENYVHPGDLRVVFLEFPYIGKNSMTAAVMNQCVWRNVRESNPDAYWRWHSAIFEAQDEESSEWASKTKLLDRTESIDGVSASDVESCMDHHRQSIESSIEADSQRAHSLGISGTPGFILYNRESEAAGKLVGAQPYERFESAIDQVTDS